MSTGYRQPGVVLSDRRFTVPLDHDNPSGETIELYAREVVGSDRADQDLPRPVYLQGGPGFGASRFVGKQAWLGRALDHHRVLLLDQRGTGSSTPANRQTLPLRGGPPERAVLSLLEHRTYIKVLTDEDPEAYVRTFLTGYAQSTGERFGGMPAVAFELFGR